MKTRIQNTAWRIRLIAITFLLLGLICNCGAQTSSGRSIRFSLKDSASALPPEPPNAAVSNLSKLPLLSVQLIFLEPSGNGILDAEETGTLKIVVTNKGKTPARRLQAKVQQLSDCRGLTFGLIPLLDALLSDSSKALELQIAACETVSSQQNRIRIEILEDSGFDLDPPVVFSFQTRQFSRPVLVLADYAIDDQNKTGKIEPRDIIEITGRVQNRGQSKAMNVSVSVSLGENISFEEGSLKDFKLGDLQSGAFKDIKFSCYANSRATSMAITFHFTEARGKSDTIQTLNLALNKPQKKEIEYIAETKDAGLFKIDSAPTVAVDVDVNLPPTTMHNPDAVAVVIGNTAYEKTKQVLYAGRDAVSIRRYLTDVLGFREENVVLLQNASKSDMELYFGTKDNFRGKLFNLIKPNASDVFVFYSGHGAPGLKDKKGYFVPVECDPNYVELQGYPIETLYSNLSANSARSVMIVIDACFSGAGLFDNISPLVLTIDAGVFAVKNGIAISSSRNDQVSSWYPDKQHGLFTYLFLKGIHGRGADLDKDGVVTVDEMYRYLSDRAEGVPYYARRINGVDQTPTFQGSAKDRILVRY